MSTFTRATSFEIVTKKTPNQFGNTPVIRTTSDFKFYLEDSMEGWFFYAPSNSLSNGGSIPKAAQSLFGLDPFDPWYINAYVMHDLLVGECGYMHPIRHDDGRTRHLGWREAAAWLNKGMVVKEENNQDPLTPIQRRMIMRAVLLYGLVRRPPPYQIVR